MSTEEGPAGRGAARRKAEHLEINLHQDVRAKGVSAGFERWRFQHQALPEIALADVNLEGRLFGRRLGAPILVSSMTGGVAAAGRINRALAEVAQAHGLAMGLGSGRVLLEQPTVASTFAVRTHAPDIVLFANLGAVQLNLGRGVDDCRRLVEGLGADALVLHLNPLQEALQPRGDTDFSGLLAAIERLCSRLGAPVVVKEVGWGIAADLVPRLLGVGVAAVDVAGAGGTSWSEVERHRLADPVRSRVAAAFAGWGIATADAIQAARAAAPGALLFASGGVTDGIDVAKAIALGADLVGLAGPFLRAAAAGEADALAHELIETLRIALFCLGLTAPGALRASPRLVPT